MEYVFEPLKEEGHYQVRLQGEFVTYTDHKDPAKVDSLLEKHGWTSRQQFYDEAIAYQQRQANYRKKRD